MRSEPGGDGTLHDDGAEHSHPHDHPHDGEEASRGLWQLWRRWQGVVLATIVLVATLWLAVTNQLVLYIHPRYIVFTVIMAVLGLVFVVASSVMRVDHEHEPARRPWQSVLSVASTVLVLALAVGLVIVPPATLTTATASQREINSTALDDTSATVADASGSTAVFDRFTVLDWASLLRQTSDRSFFADKPADVIGFVTPDPDDPDDSFYVSRFMVTCCAVDAQPVGVPVYLPGWGEQFEADAWVQVQGVFDTNPSRSSKQPLALLPVSAETVDQPSEPYLY
ncbi:putative repeat protein (TIGR03943 family) [Homoserinimonas aerilata]|uniref:Putative repeat protein (TIGR03943 family) n=1 Tax=Homoserinimonas aerilata TaxID=1162970 RepID=A0A542YIE5_9MICO|nr:TIGR03943 family protein [Homoserinimonas aerilata]TQL47781.1 putative repeat protein (TIGR03943 family) [Homoserinimonas aerilata]